MDYIGLKENEPFSSPKTGKKEYKPLMRSILVVKVFVFQSCLRLKKEWLYDMMGEERSPTI